MKFILNEYHRNVTEKALLDDLKKTALDLGKKQLSIEEYSAYGKFSPATIINRFMGWNKALRKVKLEIIKENTISRAELYENLKKVWIKLRRQPLVKEMIKPLSEYSASAYFRKFGSWRSALESFIKFAEKEKAGSTAKNQYVKKGKWKIAERFRGKKTNGDINKKRMQSDVRRISKTLRYDILQRDKYKCRVCGSSPATNPKIILHVDHIKPFSKGGKTVPENLQTLCSDCNYGKGTKSISSK